MVGHKCLSNITHIIVDEIHERDRFGDYLLITLRDLQKTYKKLKIILMSAALNVELFQNYFGTCPVIHVSGSCYDVKTYFLGDILKQTGYLNKGMRKFLQDDDMKLFQSSDDLNEKQEQSSAAADVMKLLKMDEEVTKEEKPTEEAEIKSVHDDSDDGVDVEIESESDVEDEERFVFICYLLINTLNLLSYFFFFIIIKSI